MEDVVKKYYTSLGQMEDYFDHHSRAMPLDVSGVENFHAWTIAARKKLEEILRLDQFQKVEPKGSLVEELSLEYNNRTYVRQKVLIHTEENVIMPMYVLIPGDFQKGEKRKVVIAAHGHGGAGKNAVVGRREIDALVAPIEKYNYDYGLRFVMDGYIVFAPDARGFGERREITNQGEDESAYLSTSCVPINNAAMAMGLSLTGMQIWDLLRLVDYIETRRDCDGDHIACVGFSGGGSQVLWLSALDERIKCVVVSGYFYGIRDALLTQMGHCGCNFVPGFWNWFDMCDLGALIAPRPLLIESGIEDHLNGHRGIVNAQEQLAITRTAYELLGRSDLLYHHMYQGVHMWNGEKTYDFVRKYL